MLHIHLALDNVFSQFKRFIISVLLVIISLIMVIIAMVTYEGANYTYSSCDKMLSQGMEMTGILSLETENDMENVDKLLEEVYQKEEVSAICNMNVGGVDDMLGLLDIQNENNEGYFVPMYGYLAVMSIDARGLELCKLRLSNGIQPEKLDFSQSTDNNIIYYLYLGSAYDSIPVGAQYKKEYIDATVTYIVAGIMEEGQRWIEPDIGIQIKHNVLDYTIDCTYGIFRISHDVIISRILISAQDGHTIEEALDVAHEVADKYDLEMHSTTMTELYEESFKMNIVFLEYIKEAFVIIIPAIILMLITLQIVSIRFELNTYGIMCSQGFNLKDVNKIIIIKNILMALVSLVVATPIVVLLADYWIDDKLSYIIDTVLVSVALPTAIIILIVVILIISLTSVIMLRRYTPVKLMRTRN